MVNACALAVGGAVPANRSQIVVSDGVADACHAERWDCFLAATPGGDLVQTSAWAEAKRALGFATCRVVAQAGEAIVGGGQIIIRRFGRIGALGYLARGPLVRSEWPELTETILAEIELAARARRVRHLIVQPPEGADHVTAALISRGYAENAPEVTPTATMRIDLSQSLDQILAGMSRSKRKQIRRSQREGLEVRTGGANDLDVFHSLHTATARRQGFSGRSRAYLQHHWDALHARGSVQLIFAYHQGRALAAIWLTPFREIAVQRLSGWSVDGQHLQPNVACRWGAIRWAMENGYRYYDFGGIDRWHAELMVAKQPLPVDFHRTHGAIKREFGADAVLLPMASQYTFQPIPRFLVHSVYPKLARSKSFRSLVHHFRNG